MMTFLFSVIIVAQLVGDMEMGMRRMCIYEHATGEYAISIDKAQLCPLTYEFETDNG